MCLGHDYIFGPRDLDISRVAVDRGYFNAESFHQRTLVGHVLAEIGTIECAS